MIELKKSLSCYIKSITAPFLYWFRVFAPDKRINIKLFRVRWARIQ